MRIDLKFLNKDAKLPTKAHESDAGFDLTAVSKSLDEYGNLVYGTGLSIAIPEGYEGQVRPRSSVGKYTLVLSNSVGTIDAGYRGEVKVKFKPIPYFNSRDEAFPCEYEIGDRIAQLVIQKLPTVGFNVVTELSDSLRGEGGFGSSDKKEINDEKS